MTIRSIWLGLALMLGVLTLSGAVATKAFAQACCTPTPPCCAPPPCCTPPTPPCCVTPPPTPPAPCCDTSNRTSVHVNVSNVNVAVANASARGSASGSGSGSGSVVYYGGGGGGGGYAPPMTSGVIQGLNVEAGRKRIAYEASRTSMKKVIIQAVCLDDRSIPHPASQVWPDRNVDDAFDGEIYRCIAGTWLQATIAGYNDRLDFSGGQTLTCHKNDALYHAPGGKVECRVQKPARDCNERSLLRRFGAGIKILTMITVERYTAYREEQERMETSVAGVMSLDGGVGGIVY